MCGWWDANASHDRPKEAKEPLFCCGAQHKSANYHRRTVHQQHTKIHFRGHPEAGFILRRNPVTSLFHCPHCDKSWAMATPIRNHIFQRCEGYAQYRSQPAGKSDPEKTALSTPSSSRLCTSRRLYGNSCSTAPTSQVLRDGRSIASIPSPRGAPSPQEGQHQHAVKTSVLTPSSSPGNSTAPGSATYEQVMSFPPVLRPAVWSPVNHRRAAPVDAMPVSPFTIEVGLRSLGSLPTFTRTVSACSSRSSLRTATDAPFAPPSHLVALKSEPDSFGFLSGDLSRTGSSLSGFPSPLSLRRSPERPTAVRIFLDTLRRPLGHAAPLLYKMGLVSEADLDLICTMPESWDEVGAVLQAGGVTTIEWLMVREALRMRAKEL
ncbi:hypothetical protein OH77DRAFT_1547698 [Trametes cingulata]|nr:hypothetical protein OH77DRAFT_1547698 [Trametes cingulata]